MRGVHIAGKTHLESQITFSCECIALCCGQIRPQRTDVANASEAGGDSPMTTAPTISVLPQPSRVSLEQGGDYFEKLLHELRRLDLARKQGFDSGISSASSDTSALSAVGGDVVSGHTPDGERHLPCIRHVIDDSQVASGGRRYLDHPDHARMAWIHLGRALGTSTMDPTSEDFNYLRDTDKDNTIRMQLIASLAAADVDSALTCLRSAELDLAAQAVKWLQEAVSASSAKDMVQDIDVTVRGVYMSHENCLQINLVLSVTEQCPF